MDIEQLALDVVTAIFEIHKNGKLSDETCRDLQKKYVEKS